MNQSAHRSARSLRSANGSDRPSNAQAKMDKGQGHLRAQGGPRSPMFQLSPWATRCPADERWEIRRRRLPRCRRQYLRRWGVAEHAGAPSSDALFRSPVKYTSPRCSVQCGCSAAISSPTALLSQVPLAQSAAITMRTSAAGCGIASRWVTSFGANGRPLVRSNTPVEPFGYVGKGWSGSIALRMLSSIHTLVASAR